MGTICDEAICLAARQEFSRQRVGLASLDNSEPHDSNAGSGPASIRPQGCASVQLARPARQRWRSYRPQSGGSCGGLETSRSGACGGPEPADIEGASSRSHGQAAERPALGLGEQESTYRWTVTTCRATPLACSDWSEERNVGRSRLDRVKGGGDNGKPGRTGSHPRLAVT
jgi:hypothetical protein